MSFGWNIPAVGTEHFPTSAARLGVSSLPGSGDDSDSRKPLRRGATGRRGPLDGGFDRWLDRQLHDLYDPVLKEDIPDDLSKLIERFASRPGPESSDDSGDGGEGP